MYLPKLKMIGDFSGVKGIFICRAHFRSWDVTSIPGFGYFNCKSRILFQGASVSQEKMCIVCSHAPVYKHFTIWFI